MEIFFSLFNSNALQIILKLSVIILGKPENSFYICNRLRQISLWGDTQAANEGRL